MNIQEKDVETKDERIARARELRDQDQLEESQTILLALMDDFPEDPLVLYEVGGSYDVLGEEREAIPYYEDAIEEGLSGDDLQESSKKVSAAMICRNA